jgi:hypothetical protein
MQDHADGTAIDTEPVTQLIGRRAPEIALNQIPDLVLVESSLPPECGPVGGYRAVAVNRRHRPRSDRHRHPGCRPPAVVRVQRVPSRSSRHQAGHDGRHAHEARPIE